LGRTILVGHNFATTLQILAGWFTIARDVWRLSWLPFPPGREKSSLGENVAEVSKVPQVSRNFQRFRGKSKSLIEDLQLPQKIRIFNRKSKSSAEKSKVPSKMKNFCEKSETSIENPNLPSKIQKFRRS
jgi:hypothetical protein